MKYLISFLIFASLLIYSCGNDSTTNNNNSGGETVLFSLDSLSIYLNSSFANKDTSINIINNPNVKITFNCATNADSVNTFAFYRITASDSTSMYLDSINNYSSKLNGTQIINISASNNFYVNLTIQLSRIIPADAFIKLSYVRVTKIN